MGKIEVIVAPHHRYDELSVRLKDGVEVWVNKWAVTTLDTADLAEGEEFTIERYQQEGRITAIEVHEPPPRRKSGRRHDEDDDDLEE